MKTAEISVELVDYMGTDLSVVNAARVSFHKESTLVNEFGETPREGEVDLYLSKQDEKLIKYLAKHKHTSPFNHAFITCRVKAPIFVARQLVKHKFMPWNEVSRRYVDEEPEFYWPDVWREKAENVKQGSSDAASKFMQEEQWNGSETQRYPYQPVEEIIQTHVAQLVDWYDSMIRNGVCAEQARMVLPQNMMTEWIWSGTLGAYADMLRLRLDPHTQYESRVVAQKIKALVEPLFPVSLPALLEKQE